jgi:hypothetical protein
MGKQQNCVQRKQANLNEDDIDHLQIKGESVYYKELFNLKNDGAPGVA